MATLLYLFGALVKNDQIYTTFYVSQANNLVHYDASRMLSICIRVAQRELCNPICREPGTVCAWRGHRSGKLIARLSTTLVVNSIIIAVTLTFKLGNSRDLHIVLSFNGPKLL